MTFDQIHDEYDACKDLFWNENSIQNNDIAIQRMKKIITDFYDQAVHVGVHPFVEFAGMMREYVQMLERLDEEGKCIFMNSVRPRDYELAYLEDKLECIFGKGRRSS